MQRFAVETPPRPTGGLTVTVYDAGSQTLSSIYTDGTGTTPKDNPFTIPLNGDWDFFAEGVFDLAFGGGTSIHDRNYNGGIQYVCEEVALYDGDVVAANAAASAAAQSAAAAADSETNASDSETNAATSESNAATSETNAATSETNASDSESAASGHLVSVQAVQDGMEYFLKTVIAYEFYVREA